METLFNVSDFNKTEYKSNVALGFFDGVHKGHRSVISGLKKKSQNEKNVVFTFTKAPATYFSDSYKLLIDNEEKVSLLESLDVDTVVFADFLKYKDYTTELFVEEVLKKELNASSVACGQNYTFGKAGVGDSKALKELCDHFKIETIIVEDEFYKNELVSSSTIKEKLKNGDIESANEMLTYPFFIEGEVIEGKHIGSELNIPTANIKIKDDFICPKCGVYFSKVTFDDKEYFGATNIGNNPTIEKEYITSETHLINYSDGNLYGKKLKVSLLKFIRPQIKFSTKEELKEQINKDIETIKLSI